MDRQGFYYALYERAFHAAVAMGLPAPVSEPASRVASPADKRLERYGIVFGSITAEDRPHNRCWSRRSGPRPRPVR